MLLAIVDANVLIGLAAVTTSVSGIILTIIGLRSSRREATKQAELACYDRLRAVQREAEGLSDELHRYRIQAYGGYGEQRPEPVKIPVAKAS